jgi:hypothetical protein
MKLTPDQAQHFKSIEWLISGGRGTGRTTVLALVYIKKAIDHPNMDIRIQDHERICERCECYEKVFNLIKDNDVLREHFIFKFSDKSIRFNKSTQEDYLKELFK